MKTLELKAVSHNFKVGDVCPKIEANIFEDTLFVENGIPIGFYLSKMPEKMCKLANLANSELLSERVPKTEMTRTNLKEIFDENGKRVGMVDRTKEAGCEVVKQYSTIIGSVPPKPHLGRNYGSISSVHKVKTAKTFIKSMLMLSLETDNLLKEILPEQYYKQRHIIEELDERWRFGNLYTSSISNFNISANFHRDTGNLEGCVNAIICKRINSKGGDLFIPDYNATIGQKDNSILFYPAWKNLHAVTPIVPTFDGGYRNSMVFYPLKAFKNI